MIVDGSGPAILNVSQPRVAEMAGLVSRERLACFSEFCGPLPDLGAPALPRPPPHGGFALRAASRLAISLRSVLICPKMLRSIGERSKAPTLFWIGAMASFMERGS